MVNGMESVRSNNMEDEWDEPTIKFRTIMKTTGFLTKIDSIICWGRIEE